MTDPLAGVDAVVLLSYGGPDGPDAVLPFLRNATAGRGIPDDRLAEVGAHYALFGGVSPINARNDELASELASELAERGSAVPVIVGCRNWHPFLADVFAGLAASGAGRVLCLPTSGYASYSSCRQYREDVERALAASGAGFVADVLGPYAETPGFVAANADALVAVARPGVRVLFVTHSIPQAMEAGSGPGGPEGRYSAQHRRVAAAVVARASETLGFLPEWELVYCSRSGPPQVPWLEPSIDDRLEQLAASGERDVVVAPIGFTCDHLEVVYDLDTQAAATASRLGLGFRRAATAGVHPDFVSELAGRLVAAAAQRPVCASGCCLSGRPAAPDRTGQAAPGPVNYRPLPELVEPRF